MTPSEEKARDLILEMQTALVDAHNKNIEQARSLDAANGELSSLRDENASLRAIVNASDLDQFVEQQARPWFDAFRAAVQQPAQPEQQAS